METIQDYNLAFETLVQNSFIKIFFELGDKINENLYLEIIKKIEGKEIDKKAKRKIISIIGDLIDLKKTNSKSESGLNNQVKVAEKDGLFLIFIDFFCAKKNVVELVKIIKRTNDMSYHNIIEYYKLGPLNPSLLEKKSKETLNFEILLYLRAISKNNILFRIENIDNNSDLFSLITLYLIE